MCKIGTALAWHESRPPIFFPSPPASREVGANLFFSKKNRGCTRNLKSAAPIPVPRSALEGRGGYFYIDHCLSEER
jgi:hypothetical protein